MTDDKVKRLPNLYERRKRLNLRNHIVPCQVSERWLQFPKKVFLSNEGGYLAVDVMTRTYGDDDHVHERKLCEMVLFKEDIEKMLSEFDKHENQDT